MRKSYLKKYLLITAILAVFTATAALNTKGLKIKIKVVDIVTQKPIAKASIKIEGLSLLGISDQNGNFATWNNKFSPQSLTKVEVSHPDYITTTYTLLTWDQLKNLTIELQPKNRLEEASKMIRDPAVVSPNRIQIDNTR